jgi:hypothetical protein
MRTNENLAPIIIFFYNRFDHSVKTIEALKQNEMAQDSMVFIFCDGPKANATEEQIKKIREVQDFAESITGFKKVIVEKAEKNRGLANSVIYGVTKIIKEYGKAIIVEDDIITHPYFLRFMNEALCFYANDTRIFTIGAFTENIVIPADYPHDVFLVPRVESWGWATWADRWLTAQWDITTYPALMSQDKDEIATLCKGGDDFWPMLQNQYNRKVDSWAVRWQYNMVKAGKLCLRPKYTIVKNIGLDGSGVNCGAWDTEEAVSTPYYDKEEYDITLVKDIQEDKVISDNLRGHFAIPAKPTFLERKKKQWLHIIDKIKEAF